MEAENFLGPIALMANARIPGIDFYSQRCVRKIAAMRHAPRETSEGDEAPLLG